MAIEIKKTTKTVYEINGNTYDNIEQIKPFILENILRETLIDSVRNDYSNGDTVVLVDELAHNIEEIYERFTDEVAILLRDT